MGLLFPFHSSIISQAFIFPAVLTTIHWVKRWWRKQNHKSEPNWTARTDWFASLSTAQVATSAGLPEAPDCSWLWPYCLRINLVPNHHERLLGLGRSVPLTLSFLFQTDQIHFSFITHQLNAEHQLHSSTLLGSSGQGTWWGRTSVVFAGLYLLQVFLHGHIFRWFRAEFIDLLLPCCVVLDSSSSLK